MLKAQTTATDSVPCPACSDSCSDYIKDRDGRCKYCDGSGQVTELAEVSYGKTLLEIRVKQLEADAVKLRAEARIAAPVLKAAKLWRDTLAERDERALFAAVDQHDAEAHVLKQHLDAADRATAAWVHAMAEKGAA